MRNYLVILFSLICGICASQGFKVRYNILNGSDNTTRAFFESSSGYFVGAGFTIDTSNGSPRTNISIVGLDAQGLLQWEKRYKGDKIEYIDNGFIERCFYKKNNSLYYAGCVADTTGRQVGVLIKFNTNGDTIWQKIYRDSSSIDLIPQMVTSSVDGGFLITGLFQNWITHTQQCLILKTDANGKELWRKKINKTGQNVQDGKAIVQDSATKKIAIVGYQYFTNSDIHDNLLILDSLGTKIYQGYLCTTGVGGTAIDLIQSSDKKLIMVGYQTYAQTIGGANCQRAFAVKFDINTPTIPIWKIDGLDTLGLYNTFTCLIELQNSDILIGGLVDSVQSVWNGQSSLPNNILMRLLIVDKDGLIKRKHYYNYKVNGPMIQNGQAITSINICQDGSWLAAIRGVNYPPPNPFFFVKYDSNGCDSTLEYCASLTQTVISTVGVKDILQNADIKVYPNPAHEYLNIEIMNGENVEFILSDVLGKEIIKNNLEAATKIDLSVLRSGMYLISITRNKEVIFKEKVIKN